MPPPACPVCQAPIGPKDINIAEGVAYCRACNEVIRLREVARDPAIAAADPAAPPPGCSFRMDGAETVIRASGRSLGGFVAGLFIAAFWNGIVSVFVLIALGSTLKHLSGSLPAWFPLSRGSSRGMGPGNMPAGFTIFLWVFLTPFIAIGTLMILNVLHCIAGRVDLRIWTGSAVVFSGIGPFGVRRRFDPAAVRNVSLGASRWRQSEEAQPMVVIDCGGRTIRFGSMLPEPRRVWLAAICRTALLPGDSGELTSRT